MRQKAYFMLTYNTISEKLTYKRNTVMHLLLSAAGLIIQYYAWDALYKSADYQPVMGRSFEIMITYLLVVMLVKVVTATGDVAELLEERMKSGEIAQDFCRPLSPRGIIIAQSWGNKLYELSVVAIPFLLGVFIVQVIRPPASILHCLLFIVSLFFGYLINLFFDLLCASFAFWYISVGMLSWFIAFFSFAMSGAVVPLWLLPNWLQLIAKFLPFQATIYIPMQIYLGELSALSALGALGIQVAWILLLWLIQEWLWRVSVKKIVIHGG